MRELDACGIGFVADAHGRPSRSIVTAALQGLANVKHRGAVAADARTSDGTGLLTTIPPALFGDGAGVAVLFVRGDDPSEAVEAAAHQEGLVVEGWRTPPTDDSVLGDLAAAAEAYKRALAIRFDADLAFRAGTLLMAARGEVTEETRDLYRRALAAAPPDARWRPMAERLLATP